MQNGAWGGGGGGWGAAESGGGAGGWEMVHCDAKWCMEGSRWVLGCREERWVCPGRARRSGTAERTWRPSFFKRPLDGLGDDPHRRGGPVALEYHTHEAGECST